VLRVTDQVYQSVAQDSESKSGDEHVLTHAVQIVSQSGVDALTVRALADRCGKSPSFISYRFGSKQGLLAALADHVESHLQTIWQRRFSDLPSHSLDQQTLASLSLGILVENSVLHRDLMRAVWALQVCALREPGGHARAPNFGIAASFWERVLASAGLGVDIADGLAGTLESLGHTLLIEDPAAVLTAWCADVVNLLFAHLMDGAERKSADSPWRLRHAPSGLAYSAEDLASPTRGRIIETAKAIIVSDGYRAVSHREIARRSGVSLSSTTHHFASLEDIQMSAYWSFYREATTGARAVQSDQHTQSFIEYIDQVLPEIFRSAQSSGLTHIVFEEILLLSAQKDALREMGLALFASMGETTCAMVSTLDGERPFERLDAHLFRHALRGAALQLALSPDGDFQAPLGAFLKTIFEAD